MDEPGLEQTPAIELKQITKHLSELEYLFYTLRDSYRTWREMIERAHDLEGDFCSIVEGARELELMELIQRACKAMPYQSILQRIEDLTNAHNVAQCRMIMPIFHEKLPKELRDMVYMQLINGQVFVNMETARGSVKEPRDVHNARPHPYFAETPTSAGDIMCRAHYWRPNVVGETFSAELKEAWYRHNWFHCSESYWSQIEGQRIMPFLKQDRFKTHLQPQALISKIHLSWDLYELKRRRNRDGEKDSPCLVTALEHCFRAQKGCRIHIELLLKNPDNDHMRLYTDALGSFFLPAARLQRQGYRLTASVLHKKRVYLGRLSLDPVFVDEDGLQRELSSWRGRVAEKAMEMSRP